MYTNHKYVYNTQAARTLTALKPHISLQHTSHTSFYSTQATHQFTAHTTYISLQHTSHTPVFNVQATHQFTSHKPHIRLQIHPVCFLVTYSKSRLKTNVRQCVPVSGVFVGRHCSTCVKLLCKTHRIMYNSP